MTKMERAYLNCKKMIEGKALSVAKRTTIPLDDLTAECNLIFCEAYHKYRPNKYTQFSTWLWQMLDWGMSKFASQYYGLTPNGIPESQCWWKQVTTPSIPKEVIELRKTVSDEASVLIGILLSFPQEILLMVNGRHARRARGKLGKLMRKEGISRTKTRMAINELKGAYNG